MRKHKLLLLLALAMLTVLSACGGGGGGGGGGVTPGATTSSTDVKGAFSPTLKAASVSSMTLEYQTGAAISGATVAYLVDKTNVPGFGKARIMVASAVTDAGTGKTSVALPSDTYTCMFAGLPTGKVTGEYAPVAYSMAMTGDKFETYKTDQYAFQIMSNVTFSSTQVRIYQTDSTGKVNRGSHALVVDPVNGGVYEDIREPIVFSATSTTVGSAVTMNAELFEGDYRVVVTSKPTISTNSLASYVSDVFHIAGGGNTKQIPVTLNNGDGNVARVTLLNKSGNPIPNYHVKFSETTNLMTLATVTTNTNGVASAPISKSIPKVLIIVSDNSPNPQTLAVYEMSLTATTNTAILQQYVVDGLLKASADTLTATSSTVIAKQKTAYGPLYDILTVGTTTASGTTGAFQLTLFGAQTAAITYTLSAEGVQNFPDVTPKDVNVSNDNVIGIDIPVAPGGVLMGKIQTENKQDLSNVEVDVFRPNADGSFDLIAVDTTKATGDYRVAVPYGTYFIMVDGAVTEGVSVSAASPQYQKNLTQFQITGRVKKDAGTTTLSASGATVVAGFNSATTDSLGTYTLPVMEGKNWFCAMPGSSDASFGYSCDMNVMVDASTVAASRVTGAAPFTQ